MKKVLVANRGEIACRVLRTLKKMGIQSVAVYSEADRHAPHVKMANEAICIGPPPSSQSYLRGDFIIQRAKDLGVDGIHPGYGFLSENAAFAEKVHAAGMIFIGPSAHSIRIMGSKLAAKDAVKDYGIPMVPGTDHAIDNIEEAKSIAGDIGFPILIKASAGGGGKGMRIVDRVNDFEEQMDRAMSEAQSAFGDNSVFIEKYISSPRHIEIQVLGDQHSNYVHLFERECSIQRRHQKVIEEAPSPVLTPALRDKMGQDAIKVAKSCGYFSTGTVEFLLDENMNYYFLEMNTRLQVEHPVTEFITGLDLVEQQISIARGEKLSIKQTDLSISGHAIELRVYAENPFEGFLPSIGFISQYDLPSGQGVRVDNGVAAQMDIPIYYDPLLSKLIVHAPTRDEALIRMSEAIDHYYIKGPETTLPFGAFVMKHPSFKLGEFDTHFVKKYWTPYATEPLPNEVQKDLALLAANLMESHKRTLKVPEN